MIKKITVFAAIFMFGTANLCGQAATSKRAADAPNAIPVSYGLVVDNSGSYRLLIEKIIRIVTDIVDQNNGDDEAFLITFVDAPKIVLRQDFTSSKVDLRDAAENMFIEGGYTSLIDAVKISAAHLTANAKPGTGRARALVLVTDGDENKSVATIDEVVNLLKSANIKVFVVAIAEGKVESKVIDRLSRESGGLKFSPKTGEEINAAVKNLSAAIRAK